MKKKFAVISSAYYTSGFLTSAYHHLAYEHICGFSLGERVMFFDSLETAKNIAYPPAQPELSRDDADRRKQNAVISVDCDDDESYIIGIDKIYTVGDVRGEYHSINLPGQPSVRVYVPRWNERKILKSDMTDGALAEIQKDFELRFYSKNPGNGLNYHLARSWLPVDKHYRADVETDICEKLDKQFEEEHQPERTATNEIVSTLAIVLGVSCLFTSGVFNYFITVADDLNPSFSNMLKITAFAGGLLTLAGVAAKDISADLDESKRSFVRHGLFQPENQKAIKDAIHIRERFAAPRPQ